MNKKNIQTDVTLNVDLDDSLVTPRTCTFLVNGLIKYIMYQKKMIPYPFENLQFYVSKRKDMELDDSITSSTQKHWVRKIQDNPTSEKYFKKVADAVHIIESLLDSVYDEILTLDQDLCEVVLLFGSTIVNPQDVFRIVLPDLTHGHLERNHSPRKYLECLMRNLFTNENFDKFLLESCSKPATNMFIFLKIKSTRSYENPDFIKQNDFRIPSRCQNFEFIFNLTDESSCSCVLAYYDNQEWLKPKSREHQVNHNDEDLETGHVWYQNKLTLKSFQDVLIQGVPVVSYWVNPRSFV